MDRESLRRKAETFRALHHDPRILVLPNIWDPLGARMLERMGFPAVATASAAVAWSLGHDDGQRIRFEVMLDVIRRLADAVEVPLTADVEAGYAQEPSEVAANLRRVLAAGAAGINLEDSVGEGAQLFPVDLQCARIQAVRAMADREGIPLVINARIDVFLGDAGSRTDRLAETIARGREYMKAGADCLYPIPLGDVATLEAIRSECEVPLNAYASAAAAPMRELEKAGVGRLSLGPGLIKASLTAMRNVAGTLLDYGSYDAFTVDAMSSDEAREYVSPDPMV